MIGAEKTVSSELGILNLYILSIGAWVNRSGCQSATAVQRADLIVKIDRV